MYYNDANDLDDEVLDQAAAEALDRPDPCWLRDERMYTTHGVTFAWATNSGDLLDESNFLMILAELEGIVGADDYAGGSDDLFEGTVSDWAVGPLRQIFVRVRDEDGQYTQVFREATYIALMLRDHYPVFDEADYSERQMNDFNTQWDDIAERLGEEHEHDTKDQVSAIACAMAERLTERFGYAEALSFAEDQERWDETRDMYYDALAHEHLVAQIPGQASLPV